MTARATIKNLKNGTVTVTGLTHSDLRFIAYVIEEGSFDGGDKGGPRSAAAHRFAHLLRTPCMFPGRIGNITFTCSSSDPDECYQEIDPSTGEVYPDRGEAR